MKKFMVTLQHLLFTKDFEVITTEKFDHHSSILNEKPAGSQY